ncbi:MAG: ABC transporter permease subunit [Clostridia bacterium]|nr:ABC transporter permease subunit [Clostridia bacterium]
MVSSTALAKKRGSSGGFFKELKDNWALFAMLLPGLIVLLINNYLPMFGVVIAFKRYRFHGDFFTSLIKSDWVGFKNFTFFFNTPQAFEVTRNTILYNLVFIVLGLIIPVFLAIGLNELLNKRLAKLYQSIMFLPYFLSWVVVSYLAYSFLSMENGYVNRSIITALGGAKVNWYAEPKYWPFILTFFQLWKYTGYNAVVYLAAIAGIDSEYYEAAAIDGATRWQQIRHITVPMLQPIMIIMTLLAVGRIFNADFGLFFNVPKDSGTLYSVTDVIDTYVFRALRNSNSVGMAAAAGFYQAVVGCITVFTANYIVKKIDSDRSLF